MWLLERKDLTCTKNLAVELTRGGDLGRDFCGATCFMGKARMLLDQRSKFVGFEFRLGPPEHRGA